MDAIGNLILRAGAGVLMILHGVGKWQMVFDGTADKFPDPIGLGATLSAVTAGLTEVVCAFLVVIGWYTRVAALAVATTMGVAAFVIHADDPWLLQRVGASKEPALIYLLIFFAIALLGAGSHSVDARLAAAKANKGI